VHKDKELTDEDVVLSATKRAVEASVEPEIAGVRMVFGPDGLALRCTLISAPLCTEGSRAWSQASARRHFVSIVGRFLRKPTVPIGYVALRAAPIRVAKKGKARLTLTPEASGASTSPGVQHPETTDKA
jgi:hypothetical protein